MRASDNPPPLGVAGTPGACVCVCVWKAGGLQPMAVAAYGVEEKYRNLRMRKDDQRKLAAHIDDVVRRAEGEEDVGGCTAGPCGWMRRRLAARRAAAHTQTRKTAKYTYVPSLTT